MSSPKKHAREEEHSPQEEEEEQSNTQHARKRPLVVSCHENEEMNIRNDDNNAPDEESPVHKDDTVILSKSSLDSSKSYEWFSSQVSTPVAAEPVSTISIDPIIATPAPPILDSSVHYNLREDPRSISQQQRHHSYHTSHHDPVYSHHHQQHQHNIEYSTYSQSRQHHDPYLNRQSAYADYIPYREPYHNVPPNHAPHPYSYEDSNMTAYHRQPPQAASYYSYSYAAPPEYNYYAAAAAYYPTDPRLYHTTEVVSSNYATKAAPNSDDPRMAGIPIYLACDEATLSAYQCMVRQQIEFFTASPVDVEQTIQGRNKKIEVGQVGIRCRHCKHVPPKKRARGAMYYPSKLSCIYQMAQNMASVHINQSCEHVPAYIREALEQSISDRKSLAGSGKEYWASGARSLGVTEGDGRLVFAKK